MTSKSSRRLGKLNPAFAAAHGIGGHQREPTGEDLLKEALKTARSTGKLHASNLELSAPLPDDLFNLRKATIVDFCMDSSYTSSYESHGEETLTVVNLSDNPLGGILDSRIHRYCSIGTLRAQRCKLENVPFDAISQLRFLSKLDLRGNQLNSFQIENLPQSLGELLLSSNRLVSLSETDQLIELPHLSHLDVAENLLQTLPSLKLVSLETLSCGRNELSQISLKEMDCSSTLRIFQAEHNKIESSADLSAFSSLQILDLSENMMSETPRIGPSVVKLDLHTNKIKTLSHIPGQSNLMEINLSNNQIQRLEVSIVEQLVQLRKLDLRNNSIATLPNVLGYLANMKQLLLSGNPLRTLRSIDINDTQAVQATLRKRGPAPTGEGYLPNEWMDSLPLESNEAMGASGTCVSTTTASIFLRSWTKHSIIDLGNQNLSIIPSELPDEIIRSGNAERITCIKLNNNQLEFVDEQLIEVLKCLKIMEATKNKLDRLPGNISLLRLQSLSLQSNRLCFEAIAPVFARSSEMASTLTYLDLSSNRLKWIPSDIVKRFSSLQTLNLSNNHISSLAAEDDDKGWTFGLASLEHLNLSDNRIQTLGDAPILLVAHSQSLQSLFLQNNNLERIPLELGLLESLNSIDLRGNSQRAIRSAVLEKGCTYILQYLRDRMTPEQLVDARNRAHLLSKSCRALNSS